MTSTNEEVILRKIGYLLSKIKDAKSDITDLKRHKELLAANHCLTVDRNYLQEQFHLFPGRLADLNISMTTLKTQIERSKQLSLKSKNIYSTFHESYKKRQIIIEKIKMLNT